MTTPTSERSLTNLECGRSRHVDVNDVFYSRSTIRGTITHTNSATKRSLHDTLSDLQNGVASIDDFPTIRVIECGGQLYSLNNRRMWLFKEALKGHSLKLKLGQSTSTLSPNRKIQVFVVKWTDLAADGKRTIKEAYLKNRTPIREKGCVQLTDGVPDWLRESRLLGGLYHNFSKEALNTVANLKALHVAPDPQPTPNARSNSTPSPTKQQPDQHKDKDTRRALFPPDQLLTRRALFPPEQPLTPLTLKSSPQHRVARPHLPSPILAIQHKIMAHPPKETNTIITKPTSTSTSTTTTTTTSTTNTNTTTAKVTNIIELLHLCLMSIFTFVWTKVFPIMYNSLVWREQDRDHQELAHAAQQVVQQQRRQEQERSFQELAHTDEELGKQQRRQEQTRVRQEQAHAAQEVVQQQRRQEQERVRQALADADQELRKQQRRQEQTRVRHQLRRDDQAQTEQHRRQNQKRVRHELMRAGRELAEQQCRQEQEHHRQEQTRAFLQDQHGQQLQEQQQLQQQLGQHTLERNREEQTRVQLQNQRRHLQEQHRQLQQHELESNREEQTRAQLLKPYEQQLQEQHRQLQQQLQQHELESNREEQTRAQLQNLYRQLQEQHLQLQQQLQQLQEQHNQCGREVRASSCAPVYSYVQHAAAAAATPKNKSVWGGTATPKFYKGGQFTPGGGRAPKGGQLLLN